MRKASDAGAARRMKRGKLRGQLLHRVVPAQFLECAGAALARALQRAAQAIGMVDHLKSGLTARAKLAAIHRMHGIAFELFRQAPS